MGVDRIIAEAGVAKASFYRHFPSKQALLLATLGARDGRVRDWLCSAAEAVATERGTPPALALFEVAQAWAGGGAFHGCAFLRAVFDAPGDAESRSIASAHKRCMEDWIAGGLGDAPNAAQTAAALMVLLDGGVAQAFIHDDPSRLAVARRVAERLLETADE